MRRLTACLRAQRNSPCARRPSRPRCSSRWRRRRASSSARRSPASSASPLSSCASIRSLHRTLTHGRRRARRWLGNEMQKLESEGFAPLFAYEEAIGFANGSTIRDKDGVRPSSLARPARPAYGAQADLGPRLRPPAGHGARPLLRARNGPRTLGHHPVGTPRRAVRPVRRRRARRPASSSALTLSLPLLVADRYGFHATSNSYFISRDGAVTDRIFSLLRFGNPDTVRPSPSPPLCTASS